MVRIETRRRRLLAGTALAGGFLAMLSPEPALANCVVAVGPNTVTCSTGFTANSTSIDGLGPNQPFDRHYQFTGGDIQGTVGAGQQITGTGLAFTAAAGAALTVTQDGWINQTSAGTNGGTAALALNADGGAIIYSGSGDVDTGISGATALLAVQTGATGGITIGGTGDVAATNNGKGIDAQITNSGNAANILINRTGNVNGTLGGSGISAVTAGTGSVTVTGVGNVSGGAAGVAVYGIEAQSDGGDVTVAASGTVSGGTGIRAVTTGGTVAVTVANDVTGATSDGVQAVATTGTVNVLVTGGLIRAVATSNGIIASSAGAGGATVTMTGGQVGSSASRAGAGIVAMSNGAASPLTITAGTVFAIIDGVRAQQTGATTGSIQITTNGAIDVSSGRGIHASSLHPGSSGAISVTQNAAIRARTGIQADHSGSGTVTVQVGADVTATAGRGVDANSVGGANAVNVVGGIINATSDGIRADASGAGAVTVNMTGGQIGTAATRVGNVGITATSSSGPVTVTATDIFSASTGINVGILGAGTGNITVTANGTIDAATGAGIGALHNGTGSISVTNSGAINAAGVGVALMGGAANTIANTASITGGTGVQTADGSVTVTNAGAITGTGGTAVLLFGANNLFIMQGPAASLTGTATGSGTDTFRLAGTGANTFDVAQIGAGWTALQKTDASSWTLTGTATTAAAVTVDAGTLAVNGSLASAGSLTVNAGGTLGGTGTVGTTLINGGTLAAGNSIGTLTVQGNLAFTTAATYLVEVSPGAADRTSVSGTVNLAGTVNAVFLPGTYLQRTYTILSAGTRNGTFDTFTTTNLPSGFTASLSYTGTEAILNLQALLGPKIAGLNQNQRHVAVTLDSFYNNGGALPPSFVAVFGLAGTSLASTLSQLSGEVSAGGAQAAFQSTQSFLNMMLDPFAAGRSGGVGPLGFAAEPVATMPDEIALAYGKAMPVKAASLAYEPRWSVWGGAYGGAAKVDGDATLGSTTTDSRTGGFAAGADYRIWPDTMVGFALAGGGTSWSLANGLGSGRSDTFQAGLYGSQGFGAAYLSAALAYAWHDTMTTRSFPIGPETLEGKFRPQVLAARGEAGYRFGWASWGLTPYTAAQVQSFRAPSYTETATSGAGTFALSYASQTETATRTELGLWADHRQRVNADTELLLRGRVAWAHDFDTSRRINPTFVALPGAGFTIDGAAPSPDLALLSAVAELRLQNGISLSAKFDGEFGSRSESYAATGTLRYSW